MQLLLHLEDFCVKRIKFRLQISCPDSQATIWPKKNFFEHTRNAADMKVWVSDLLQKHFEASFGILNEVINYVWYVHIVNVCMFFNLPCRLSRTYYEKGMRSIFWVPKAGNRLPKAGEMTVFITCMQSNLLMAGPHDVIIIKSVLLLNRTRSHWKWTQYAYSCILTLVLYMHIQQSNRWATPLEKTL